MTDLIRKLTDTGIERFAAYLAALRAGHAILPPSGLLTDPATSEGLPVDIMIESHPQGLPFTNRYDFGCYLQDRLATLDRRAISRDYQLWTWLALYYFDQLCPAERDGYRKALANEAYILSGAFRYNSYYRHLVRTPWLAVCEHGQNSRVLLVPAGKPSRSPLAHRGEIIEQLAARQSIFGSRSIIEGASRLYFDPEKGRPKRGAGGSARGSPRRLALVIQQLDLTYDLRACDPTQFLRLLPREFDRWQVAAEPAGAA